MLKKTIKYTDYNGNEQSEDFYFNLNRAELTELEFSAKGGLDSMIKRISNEKDNQKLVELFKKIILMSYGKKSDDGRRFIKSEELRQDFEQTEAFVELFMELSSNADSALKFVNGIIPKEIEDHKEAAVAPKSNA
jgi:hypothetical protein